jgi:hypothetical protein
LSAQRIPTAVNLGFLDRSRYFFIQVALTVNINLYGVKSKIKILLGRLRVKWEDNIKMDLKQIGLYGVYWINPAWDMDQWRALVNTFVYHKMLEISWPVEQVLA